MRHIPPLADVTIDLASLTPNASANVVVQSPAVLVRARTWTDKRRPPKWTHALAAELVLHLRDAEQEHLVVFLLDKRRCLIGIYAHTRGSASQTGLYVLHVMKMALLTGAAEVVLVHNHPGHMDVEPSEDDILTTRRTARILDRLGVVLDEHIIVADNHAALLRVDEGGKVRQESLRGTALCIEGAIGDPDDMVPRGMHRPFGKHDVWLVESGLVRSEKMKQVRAKMGEISAPSALPFVEATWRAMLAEHGEKAAREHVVILSFDSRLLLTSLVTLQTDHDADIAKTAVLQGLLSGAVACIVVMFGPPGAEKVGRAKIPIMLSIEMENLVDRDEMALSDWWLFDPAQRAFVYKASAAGDL